MSEILSRLNNAQQEAVTATEGPVLIIAGAGSGKTRALTHRIAYLISQGVRPENILALTFTNKAADEMRSRVFKLISSQIDKSNPNLPTYKLTNLQTNLFVGTFHSFAANILRREIGLLGRGRDFVIYDEADSLALVKESMAELAVDPERFKPGGVRAAISKQKNELVDAVQYRETASEFYERTVANVFEKYAERLAEANAADFDDLLLLAVGLFQKFPETLAKYQDRFKYILVDEYQDTNRAQYVFLKLLAQKHKNICVVGDDWQSVYMFRGADFRNILSFEKDYPGAKVVLLEENYRSSQNILDAAHGVIEKNIYKTQKRLWTQKAKGDKITLVEADNETEEALFVTNEIKKLLRDHPVRNFISNGASQKKYDLNDFVVLYRTNAQSRALEEAVIRQGWPYRLVGAVKFYERREVKDIICYLRVIQNGRDMIGLKRIINTPPRGIGKATWERVYSAGDLAVINHPKVEAFLKLIAEFRREAQEKNLPELLQTLLAKIQYKNYCMDGTEEGRSRWENVLELATVAQKFKHLEPPHGLTAFLEELALAAAADDVSDEDGCLNLMTLHSAKGLEFSVVFIAGAEEGLLPHSRSFLDAAEMEEERRLCYVGLTRAKDKAYFLFTRRRALYGESKPSAPSRFLEDIPVRLVEFREYEAGDGEDEKVWRI